MLARIRRRTAGYLSEPLPPRRLIGWAAALGLLPVLLTRLRVVNAGPGPYGRVATVLVLDAIAGGLAAAGTLLLQHMGREWYRFAAGHRRAVWTGLAAASAWAVLLAVTGVVALGWSGGPVGGAASSVVTALCAIGVAAVSVLLLLGRLLAGGRRAVRRTAVALGLYLSAALFLLLTHRPPGVLLMGAVLAVVFLSVSSLAQSRTHEAAAPYLAFVLLLGVLVLSETGGYGGAARVAVQALLAAVLGTVTVLSVRRLAHWHGRMARYAGAAAIVPLAYVLYVWWDGQLLGGPWEAPLFVPMLWLAVRLWRRMQEDARPLVSAAADIVFAVLLGAVLVLFLAWLANVLDLPAAEVRALRGAAEALGGLIDLPWWTWAAADVLLAAAFLAAALGPRRLRRAGEVLGRLRLPGVLDVLGRTLSVLKIVLMSLVFLGLAGPPAVGPVLGHRIREHYTVDRQEELDARGRTALYQQITLRFTGSPQALPVLAEMLTQVHDRSAPRPGEEQPTASARDLAHRMGELQARTFPLSSLFDPAPPSTAATAAGAAAREAGMDAPVAGSADLTARLTREEEQAAAADAREQEAERAAEHAAAAVTAALGNLTFGHGVVVELVREYLDGLAEGGLGDLFLSWIRPALSRSAPEPPPSGDRLVEPDAAALRQAADYRLSDALRAAGILPGTDPEQARYDGEPPVAAAVDLAARARDVEHGTARCGACVHFHEPGERGGRRGGEEGGVHVR
ncbi:hypothetical protein [Streptomyces sp. NPDC020983]|uniref:hypothetical protein n=1 Tax=Streptomyces sp. NPDC020983 TaxID=3365106 RepID=UPI0037B2F0F9